MQPSAGGISIQNYLRFILYTFQRAILCNKFFNVSKTIASLVRNSVLASDSSDIIDNNLTRVRFFLKNIAICFTEFVLQAIY